MKAVMAAPALKRVGTLMGGTVLGQLAVFAVTPVLTRLYAPEAFNDFGIYLAVSGIFSVVATLRLEAAVPVARNDSDALNLTRIALKTSAGVAVLAVMLTRLALLLGWLTVQSNSWLFAALVGVSVFLIGAFQAVSALQIRHDGFGIIARAKAAQGVVLAAGQVALGSLFPLPIALIAGDTGSRVAGLGSSLKLYRTEASRQPLLATGEVLRQYRKFPQYSAPAALVNALGLQAPVLLLGAFLSPAAVGLYVFANRLVAVPVGLLARTLGQVFLGEIGKAQANNRPLQPIVARYAVAAAGVTGLLALCVFPFTGWLVPVLFGQSWTAAVPTLNALLLLSIIQIAASTVSQTMNATGHNAWQFAWDVTRLIAVAGTVAWVASGTRELLPTVKAYTLVSIIAYVVLLILTFFSAYEKGSAHE